ncbi:unnamed protein product [Prunus armeniaca]
MSIGYIYQRSIRMRRICTRWNMDDMRKYNFGVQVYRICLRKTRRRRCRQVDRRLVGRGGEGRLRGTGDDTGGELGGGADTERAVQKLELVERARPGTSEE